MANFVGGDLRNCWNGRLRPTIWSLGIGILALLLSVKPVPAGGEALDLEEIRTLLIGNTIHGIGEESGYFFVIYYRQNGVASGKSSLTEDVGHVWYDVGRWEMTKENGYCLQWSTWKHGKKRCMNMFRLGGGYEFRTQDGVRQSTVEILNGNPDGL